MERNVDMLCSHMIFLTLLTTKARDQPPHAAVDPYDLDASPTSVNARSLSEMQHPGGASPRVLVYKLRNLLAPAVKPLTLDLTRRSLHGNYSAVWRVCECPNEHMRVPGVSSRRTHY
jgi:hypothetical protein